ncbi:AAA family ATPase [Bradyrhizobium sp. WYCCWR 13023]|uniref:AAA family ATPase n=1 Tax=Bradyrhizobium zhengyangense TaxID=2911009 RepID=A0A9X1UB22_9BRAD|nr:adenylate/guanylate cyclase domain-containing protein [Bradyrhizobium zhengyangense]MCG2631800.1 AAA family ATPase [Bradyrhizobium zhengyangense]
MVNSYLRTGFDLDVERWLAELDLGQYVAAFKANNIDGALLADVTAEDLESIGVHSVGHRRKLLAAISRLPPVSRPSPQRHLPVAGVERGSQEAERRQLTVMFVDLVGSTALSSQLDPEDMRSVLTAYQNAVAGAVTRFEGNVAKYMGDGVLCYFGYPRAHEDDAERAVRAGSAICQTVKSLLTPSGSKLSARIGIATGLVVVGDLVGAGAAQEEAVVGDTPNFAARLQALATPGQIVVAASTRRLLGDVFSFGDLVAQELKGISGKTPAFAVLGERASESRFEARASGAIFPLVGREHELALMLERWRRTKSAEGQVVVLTGEAGIGKSRLTRAMIDAVSREPHIKLSYQCSPYHTDSPLYPVIQQLAFAAGFAPDDSNEDKLDRLDRIVVGAESDRLLLAALMGLDYAARYGNLNITAQQQRTRTLDALAGQLAALASQKPVFFIMEDVHWIDPTTLELIDLCLERVARSRVHMLITARPTFQHGFGGHPIVTKLALNKLGRDQVAGIVERLTGGKSFPAEVLDVIAEKTDGVPLFVEEMTKTVLESGELNETETAFQLTGPLSRLTIPATLYDSLMARLDRLQPVKQVAQAAACIGRDFDYRLLKSIVALDDASLQDALERLASAELIFRRGTPPDAKYIFKHALVRDAAYENLLKTRRQALHARLVEVLESECAAPEILAQHAAAAGNSGLAVRSWLAAGESAAARSANKEAASHFNAAIRLLEETQALTDRDTLRLQLYSALTSVLMVSQGYGSDDVGRVAAKTVDLCRTVGDEKTFAPVLWQVWLFNYTRSNLDEALTIAHELHDRMREAEDRTARIVSHTALGLTLFARGEMEAALKELDVAVQTDQAAESITVAYRYGMDVGAAALAYRAWCHAALSRERDARNGRAALLSRLDRTEHVFTQARGLNWSANISAALKDWDEATNYAARGATLAHEFDLRLVESIGRAVQNVAIAATNKDSASLVAAVAGISAYRQTGARIQVPFLLGLVAEVAIELQIKTIADQALAEAWSLIEETGERQVALRLAGLRDRQKGGKSPD